MKTQLSIQMSIVSFEYFLTSLAHLFHDGVGVVAKTQPTRVGYLLLQQGQPFGPGERGANDLEDVRGYIDGYLFF